MGTKSRTRFGDNYESLADNESTDPVKAKRIFFSGCTTTLCRPLRIFQFLTILLLFALVIYMTAKSAKSEPIHLSHPASILLTILTASYLFFIAIDIISQFGRHGLPDSPMFLFSFLGVVLFAVAGALLIHYRDPDDNLWALILSQVLCFIISLLFLIEITLLITYWRQKCLSWKKCYPFTPAGACGQSEIKTIFTRNYGRDIDMELGRCNFATSISRCAIPLETTADCAVDEHGCRKIGIGHRRQYVDCHSSVPALAFVQIAQIQTDTGHTVITESQTARTEMIESMMQTNSRCELCNRQMEGVPPPLSTASPPPSPETAQSRYSSMTRAQLPQIQAPISPMHTSITQLPVETVPYNVPQIPIAASPQIQRGNCAVCPTIYHMMQGGIPVGANPCCQSCNCGAKTTEPRQAVPYLLEQTTQRIQSATQADWPQPEPSTSTSTPKPLTENESFEEAPSFAESSTTKVATGGSNLVVGETNRYRPSKKLSRVYETRPCPTHGAGLAARMAGLPEVVTKVTLSTICFRRNKRTQTPVKKSDSSQIQGDREMEQAEEEPSKERSFIDESKIYRSQVAPESIRNFTSGRNDLTSKTLSDARVRIISEDEARKLSQDLRNSGSSLSIKPIRESGVLLKETELQEENMELRQNSKSGHIPIKPESSGKFLWQSDKSEPRISVPMEIDSSWLHKDFSSNADSEKSSQSTERSNRESRIKFREEPHTSEDSKISLRADEPSDSGSSKVFDKRIKKISETSNRERSTIGSIAAPRVRLETTSENSETRPERYSGAIPHTKSISRSKVLRSKADTEVPLGVTSKNVSKGKLRKENSKMSSRSLSSRKSIERPSKTDSEISSASKNRLSKENSRLISNSRNKFSKEGSQIPFDSKIEPISEHSEISTGSIIRSRTKEQKSKKDSELPSESKIPLSQENSEISSDFEKPSKISSKERLSMEDSMISTMSISSRKLQEPIKVDTETPSYSRIGIEESLSRSEYDRENSSTLKGQSSKKEIEKSIESIITSRLREKSHRDLMPSNSKIEKEESQFGVDTEENSRNSRGHLSRKDSDISSETTIELLRRAESDTPFESKTSIDQSLMRLEKSEDYPDSKERIKKSNSLIVSRGSPSGSASKELDDQLEFDSPSASIRQSRDNSEKSTRKGIKSHGSVIKFDDNSQSYADQPVGQRKFTVRKTPYPSKQLIDTDDDSDDEKPVKQWREELIEKLEADESEIFTPSKEISRTKPKKERTSEIRDSNTKKNIDELHRRSSTQKIRSESSEEHFSDDRPFETSRRQSKRSKDESARSREHSPEQRPSETSRRQSKRSKDESERSREHSPEQKPSGSSRKHSRKFKDESEKSGEPYPEQRPSDTSKKQFIESKTESSTTFAYAPASWSSKGNILQSRSRIEPQSTIEFNQARILVCDPHTGMSTGFPVPAYPQTWQCIENPQCSPAMTMDYECMPIVCIDEHVCADPCSCRLQQGSTKTRQRPISYFTPEGSSINHCNIETPRQQCPLRVWRCPRAVLRWNSRRQQAPTAIHTSRLKEPKRINSNSCYVS